MIEQERSRAARAAAEAALVRVVHHYGATPEFVLLGGLVPEMLCSKSEFQHAGTTDIDVQVNLEIAFGAANAARLETALRNAEFIPTNERIWRWVADSPVRPKIVVKFELLADLDDRQAGLTFAFDDCSDLGAVNLRGTRFAVEDFVRMPLRAKIGGVWHEVEIKVASVAGFLLAKTAAARSRRKQKDWYDIAFVLRFNDYGGVDGAAKVVLEKFGEQIEGLRSSFDDLAANFASPECQGPQAYADQMIENHPEEDRVTLLADAAVTVTRFRELLFETRPET